MSEIRLDSIDVCPIKSWGPPVSVQSANVTEYGLEHDRWAVLISDNDQMLTLRSHPQMILGQTRIGSDAIYAAAPGQSEIAIPFEQDTAVPQIPVTIFKKPGTGYLQEPHINQYFSDYLHEAVRVLTIAQPREIKKECQREDASRHMAFADGFQFTLGNFASASVFNSRLVRPVSSDLWRMNFMVSGPDALPYDEDYWRGVSIGDLSAFVVRALARCNEPEVNVETGTMPAPNNRPIAAALEATRYGHDHLGSWGVFFGQCLAHAYEPGVTVRVGDAVTVSSRAPERNVTLFV